MNPHRGNLPAASNRSASLSIGLVTSKGGAYLLSNERLDLFCHVCDAVQYAHSFEYVHRDIKPSNVLVTEEGVPKLLDFGVAKLIDPRSRRRMVTTEMRVGTPRYASPEQLRGDRGVNTTSDVYSLGVVLYEMLTGHLPTLENSRSAKELALP